MDFEELYGEAVAKLNPRRLSKHAEAGQVAAAILTDKGNVYTGVCVDTACALGFCAESAAIAAMVNAGESRIVKLVAVNKNKQIIAPCGRCREFICQICENNDQCEVLLGGGVIKAMKELLPDRWD